MKIQRDSPTNFGKCFLRGRKTQTKQDYLHTVLTTQKKGTVKFTVPFLFIIWTYSPSLLFYNSLEISIVK